MEIRSVLDPAFREYGTVVAGLPLAELSAALSQTPCPDEGTRYLASDPGLESLPVYAMFRDHLFGGMDSQLGWCNGHNTKLNGLEYHRSSEFNLGTEDFILLLAHRWEMEKDHLDTHKVRAFLVPKGMLVEIYATTLHFAPCSARAGQGFRVLVALPRGTNGPRPEIQPQTGEDALLWMENKWLLCHPASTPAAKGAFQGLVGDNLNIAGDIAEKSPVPLEIERKFLIRYPDRAFLEQFPGGSATQITQTYLLAQPGLTRRVRKRGTPGNWQYILTEKRRRTALTAEEMERQLTEEEYLSALEMADPARKPVEKIRYVLPYAGHLLEVDLYSFWQDRATLEVELQSEEEVFQLPPEIQVVREVSADFRYKNVNLAKEIPMDELE